MKLLPVLFILLLPAISRASFVFNDNSKKAYTDVMCLRFNQAETRIQLEKKSNPKNQVPYLIENYIDFLKVVIGEEETDFIRFQSNKDLRLQKLASEGQNSPWYLYSQSLIYLQSGVARIKFGEYVNASLDINRAYRLLIENQRKYPGFVMNKAGLGILHSLIGTIPAKYKWAVHSLKFDGSITQGLAEIKQAYQEVASDPELSYLLPETAFLLAFATLNLSADVPGALKLAEKYQSPSLKVLIMDSPLLVYSVAAVYARNGENDKVIKTINDGPHSAERYSFQYLNYMLGIAKLNRLDQDACYPLLNFLGNFKGKNYIRSAYMHLAWYYLIQNDQNKYQMYVERIALRGNDQVDNDREALSFAIKNMKPDLPLLKARLLSDGGYYARAKHELDGYKAGNKKDGLEYTYRMARIYHNWGKIKDAIPYYLETISSGENLPYYYAANSTLQLGMIYEKQKDFLLANKYFLHVLQMDFDEYHFSISNKAQAGLNRIKGK